MFELEWRDAFGHLSDFCAPLRRAGIAGPRRGLSPANQHVSASSQGTASLYCVFKNSARARQALLMTVEIIKIFSKSPLIATMLQQGVSWHSVLVQGYTPRLAVTVPELLLGRYAFPCPPQYPWIGHE